mgnify:CR=1 FL=1
MATPIEVGLLVLVVAAVVGVYLLSKLIKPLVVNAVVGLIVLFVAGWLGYGAAITPIVLLLVAFGGLPAALLVIVLAQLGIIFDPAFLVPLL